ncbi:hypothetical protein HanRHA438_Chr04g0156591 [Helianthus annuus]|nr:hypothetical protein HanRHA438_Chr04g0156591 [Helianthus annuus]
MSRGGNANPSSRRHTRVPPWPLRRRRQNRWWWWRRSNHVAPKGLRWVLLQRRLLKLLLLRVVLRVHGRTVIRLVHGRVVMAGGVKPIVLLKPLLVAVNTIEW